MPAQKQNIFLIGKFLINIRRYIQIWYSGSRSKRITRTCLCIFIGDFLKVLENVQHYFYS